VEEIEATKEREKEMREREEGGGSWSSRGDGPSEERGGSVALRLIRRTVNDGWGGSIASRNGTMKYMIRNGGEQIGHNSGFSLDFALHPSFEARSRLYKQ